MRWGSGSKWGGLWGGIVSVGGRGLGWRSWVGNGGRSVMGVGGVGV